MIARKPLRWQLILKGVESMARYKHYDYCQTKMLPVSYEQQILPGTFEHTLSYLIDEKIDLSVFEWRYKNEETGAPGLRSSDSPEDRADRWCFDINNAFGYPTEAVITTKRLLCIHDF